MYSANLIGKQMDTVFGLYLPEYSIPAPEVKTNYKEIPFRDGAIDKTSPDGVVHYKDREWDLTFKKTGATVSASDLAALAMSVMNSIHGKAGEIIFDDDPNYKWVGRVFVTSVNCENNGLLIVNIHMITHPYKYSLADIVVVDEIQTTSDEYEGSIVSLTGGIGKSITELLVDLSPIQDLHGYATPWPAGGGVNKLNAEYTESITLSKVFLFDTPLPAGQYTFSFISADTSSQVNSYQLGRYRDETGSYVYTAVNPTQGFATFINTEPCSKIVLYSNKAYSESTGFTTVFTGLMFKAGGTGQYSPYSNICPISGRTGLNVYRTGINIWDEEWELGAFNNTTGAKASSSNTIRSKNPIAIRPETEYCFVSHNAVYLYFYDANGDFLPPYIYKAVSGGKVNFTSPQHACYMNFYSYGTSYAQNKSINYPSTDTEYHAYTGTTYASDWTSPAGTVYGCTIDLVTGVLTVDRVCETITKDSAWTSFYTGTGNSSAGVYLQYYQNCKYVDGASSRNGAISSTGEEVPNYWTGARPNESPGGLDMCFAYSYSGLLRFHRTDVANITDLNAFKAAFPDTQICYYLATPLTYQLTQQEVVLLVGTNNIWSTGDSVSVTLSTMDKVTLVNHGKPMNPKINVVSEGSVTLLFEIDGTRYTAALSAGEYTLPDLVLFDGSTDVYEAGEGTITYTYPEVSL